jgi:hypothetical protein
MSSLDPATAAKLHQLLVGTSDSFVSIAAACGIAESTVRRHAKMLPSGSYPLRRSCAELRVTFAVQEQIIELAAAGMTPAEIGERVNRGHTSVYGVIRRHAKRIRKAGAGAAEADTARESTFAERLRRAGWPDDFIDATVRAYPRLSVSAQQVSA